MLQIIITLVISGCAIFIEKLIPKEKVINSRWWDTVSSTLISGAFISMIATIVLELVFGLFHGNPWTAWRIGTLLVYPALFLFFLWDNFVPGWNVAPLTFQGVFIYVKTKNSYFSINNQNKKYLIKYYEIFFIYLRRRKWQR